MLSPAMAYARRESKHRNNGSKPQRFREGPQATYYAACRAVRFAHLGEADRHTIALAEVLMIYRNLKKGKVV